MILITASKESSLRLTSNWRHFQFTGYLNLNKQTGEKWRRKSKSKTNFTNMVKAKSLLWFYAHTFNWTAGRPSFYSQDKICALVGMSPKTYQKTRKYLENLGWIECRYRGYSNSVVVFLLQGQNDPDYKKNKFAQGHPDLISTESGNVDLMELRGFDPFSPNARDLIPL